MAKVDSLTDALYIYDSTKGSVKMAAKRQQRATRRSRTASQKKRRRSASTLGHAGEYGVYQRLAWYLGLALMAAFEVIDWPVAIVIGVGHEIAHRTHRVALRELAEGIEAAG